MEHGPFIDDLPIKKNVIVLWFTVGITPKKGVERLFILQTCSNKHVLEFDCLLHCWFNLLWGSSAVSAGGYVLVSVSVLLQNCQSRETEHSLV